MLLLHSICIRAKSTSKQKNKQVQNKAEMDPAAHLCEYVHLPYVKYRKISTDYKSLLTCGRCDAFYCFSFLLPPLPPRWIYTTAEHLRRL